MTSRHAPEALLARDELVAAPQPRACQDQSFDLPGGIYAAMAFMFLGFIAVLSTAFPTHMGVSFAIIFAFMAAFFAVPGLFSRVKAGDRAKPLDWFEFADTGVATATGRTSAFEATVLVLMLPFLILCFGIAIATIAAFV